MTTTIDWGTPWDSTVTVTLEGDQDYIVIETDRVGKNVRCVDLSDGNYSDGQIEHFKAVASEAVRGFDPSDRELRAAGMIL